ncbi:MAG: NADH:ubiquinone reductase (Na(+)-transporting) subunit F, partial [Sinomicrobium sp.]|nr:NADH:ubiquinone reductase (Na(+)-transporting) subunit F [Sinomicrobium sp.]
MDYSVIVASLAVFLLLIFILVTVLLVAKAKLVPSGPVTLHINNEKDLQVTSGGTLLSTLGNNKIFLPSA